MKEYRLSKQGEAEVLDFVRQHGDKKTVAALDDEGCKLYWFLKAESEAERSFSDGFGGVIEMSNFDSRDGIAYTLRLDECMFDIQEHADE